MNWGAAVGFGLAVLPICLTPGASFTLVTQRVAANGRWDGVLVILGTATGLCTHAALAALGLSALVMRSAEAFTVVRLLGAVYLVYLGVSLLWSSRAKAPRRLPWTGHGSYLQGLLGNVLNPKAASVYLTLAPQFLDPAKPIGVQLAVLAAAHVVVAASWLLVWTFAVSGARTVVGRPGFRRVLDRVTATVLIVLGLRTAAPR
ncbi:LysE family translocator [Kutzneria albida]|uniref:Lysine exporter protein LysE/YggA n=1 Tax=Kutzneria albida DSM 43870 TaxID=1449976 RepID=W5WD79_9PSEU|nr:LysE family translocator [Kutzneria albida]AHH96139.1 lysine exporter protein LysE/YggA [Kutzneria albida DSM 43870]